MSHAATSPKLKYAYFTSKPAIIQRLIRGPVKERVPDMPPPAPAFAAKSHLLRVSKLNGHFIRKSPLAPLFQRGVNFLPLEKGG